MSHDCSYPVTDTAAFQDTDDADAVTVLAAVRHCANSWEGDARLLGNVRARDIARACTLAIDALSQPVSVAQAPRETVIEECAKVADRAAASDHQWAARYPDEAEKVSQRAHRAMTIATAIRALSSLPSTEGN